MFSGMGRRKFAQLLLITAWVCSFSVTTIARGQGPTSRAVLPGGGAQGGSRSYGYGGTPNTSETIPVPDMFRTEAPLVERNVRFDYVFSHHRPEPPADESQFFTEVSYAFSEKFGAIFSAPYLIRNNFKDPDVSGFGDIAIGIRYVAIGSEQTARFKMAFGFNVLGPTGDETEELGESQAVLEPEILMQYLLSDQAFAQLQLSLGLPTESGGTTEFVYNAGIGYVFKDFPKSHLFAYPTAILELNGFSGVGGEEAGLAIVDLTSGLRWSVGEKVFAGIAASVPVTGPREFESQFIFSLIYRYGVEPGVPTSSGGSAPSSRAYF